MQSYPEFLVRNQVYDPNTLSYVPMTQPGAGGGGDGAITDGANALIKATVFDLTNSNPAAVTLVDANGDPYVAGAAVGGATEAKQDTGNTSLGSIDTKLTSQATAAKQDLLLTEFQLKADLTETQPVSLATLPALVAGAANIGDVDVLTLPALVAGSALIGKVGIDQTTPGTTNAVQANAGTNLNTSLLALEAGGNLALVKAKTDNIPPLGQAVAAASVPVILPSATITTLTPPAAITGFATSAKQDTLLTELQLKADLTETQPVKEIRSASAAVTAVADNAASVTLLAANANRLGAMLFNDSSAALYVKHGTTASLTDYSVKLVSGAYYEVPYGFTGRMDGIWATDPGDGAARITELT